MHASQLQLRPPWSCLESLEIISLRIAPPPRSGGRWWTLPSSSDGFPHLAFWQGLHSSFRSSLTQAFGPLLCVLSDTPCAVAQAQVAGDTGCPEGDALEAAPPPGPCHHTLGSDEDLFRRQALFRAGCWASQRAWPRPCHPPPPEPCRGIFVNPFDPFVLLLPLFWGRLPPWRGATDKWGEGSCKACSRDFPAAGGLRASANDLSCLLGSMAC